MGDWPVTLDKAGSAIPRCTHWLRKSACRSGRHKTTWRSWRPRNSSGRVRRFAGRAQTSNAYQFLWHKLLEEGVKKAAPEGVSAERYRATLTVHARCKEIGRASCRER